MKNKNESFETEEDVHEAIEFFKDESWAVDLDSIKERFKNELHIG